ncbi:MAG: hypothetical protein HDR19_00150 [Lachnospiraceae bacterium]|nr:hypothetical protein [Lachnospiraceae bacterium]
MEITSKNWFNELITLAASMLTTVALFADVESTGNLSMALNGDGIPQLIALAVVWAVYRRWIAKKKLFVRTGRREQIYSAVTAFLFTMFMLIGKAQTAEPDLKYELLAILLFFGYMPLFYVVTVFLFNTIEDASKKQITRITDGITQWIFEKHVTAGVMLVVILCRLPYLIAFYPCSMSWDGGAQICCFFGTEPFTNHHPPLISYLYGAIAWYSQEWGIPNIGMFAIPVMQTLLSAFALAKVCEFYKRLRLPYWIRWGSLIYYAAFTVWCIFDVTVIKDTLYYPLTLLFALQLISCLIESDWFWSRKRNFVLMIVYAVLMMQTRNNGVFVALFALPFVICFAKGKQALLIAGTCMILFANTILNNGLYPALGVISLDTKEDVYCILFQQTAKYGQDYPEDVTDEERALLDTIFDYDEMVEVYNPQLADWVKNCLKLSEYYSADHTNKEFSEIKGEYFKVWFAQFLRHPMSYVKTFLECSYGYYYPEAKPYKEGTGFYETDRNMLTTGMHAYRQIKQLKPVRFLLEQVSKAEYLPGIGLLYRCGFYTWCVLFAAMYLLAKKRYRLLIAVIPPAVNILVCLISPVNTCLRYAMPTMCMVPVLIGLLFLNEDSNVIG